MRQEYSEYSAASPADIDDKTVLKGKNILDGLLNDLNGEFTKTGLDKIISTFTIQMQTMNAKQFGKKKIVKTT